MEGCSSVGNEGKLGINSLAISYQTWNKLQKKIHFRCVYDIFVLQKVSTTRQFGVSI